MKLSSLSSRLFLALICRIRTSYCTLQSEAIGNRKDFQNDENAILKTTLYVEKCIGDDFEIYSTPIDECYSGKDSYNTKQNLRTKTMDEKSISANLDFNNPYGEHDIKDELVKQNGEIVGIQRSFFQSTNSTCTGGITDSFPNIPLDTCVGPFGEPRPWGVLNVINLVGNKEEPEEIL